MELKIIDEANKKDLVISLATLVLCPWYAGCLLSGFLMGHFSRRINSEEELQELIDKEADKLGLNKRGLVGRLSSYYGAGVVVCGMDYSDSDNPELVPSERIGEKDVEEANIILIGKILANRATVRHEVYHMAKGHCKDDVKTWRSNLKHYFLHEPAAILYSLTGIESF